jgi:solute:Na+ symporter, SSS family
MNARPIRLTLLALLLSPALLQAAEADPGAPRHGLLWIDWLVVALYGAGTLFIGWRCSRGDRSTSSYFIGSGRMNPVLIGVSLFATLLSTITYMSLPGETLGKGPAFISNYLSYPFVFAVVAFGLLPLYMRHRVQSAYELLEERLGLSVRLLGAGLFLLLRLVWMSLMIYLTSNAIAIMAGVGEAWVPLIALVSGLVAVTYTSMGGLRAVVVTDLMQTLLLYGGALLVIGTVTVKMGGFAWFPTEWRGNWDRQVLFTWDWSERVTVVGSILSVFFWSVATLGGDQVSVQRFMATRDIRAARRALAVQLGISIIVGLTLACVGFALLGYFEAFPGRLGEGLDLKHNADKVFPHFIAFHLPPVVSGLVVSGLFAAAMSSLDSGVNSITAVVMRDFLDRFGIGPKSDTEHFRLARRLAFGIGAVVVAGSSLMKHVPGNFTAVTGKTVNFFTVPIFCLFVFALVIRFASPVGVWIGTACGITAAGLIAFSGPLFVPGFDPKTMNDPVSFQWMQLAAFLATMAGGCLGSLIFPRRDAAKAPLQ